MRLILLGPPGAGKGTQAKFISEQFNLPHISTGDLFMRNMTNKTVLGLKAKEYMDQGLLVPDHLTIDLVKNRLEEKDAKKGYLLDGFPRNVNQAQVLCDLLDDMGESLDGALLIDVPSAILRKRMPGRRICPACGATFHVEFNPPKEEGICDRCGHSLIQRRDDREEAVEERLRVYEEHTFPLLSYFKKKKILKVVDGTQPIEDVFASIKEVLKELE